ncbi:MAG: CDP-diacylglycerol--serine O-phosphatidyltransferase [Deltaproteobacteria bacterium]|jgi:CDP-diacylglycerol--serine O-phosphatidyltransferase|nr:CDP-diacylglycerol--serine O-phosphatidyltransferase [Deltaproteobacteria bacterium]
MSQKRKNRAKERRAVYLLPNLFTTFSLFAGFYSIVSSVNGRFVAAAWAIILAAVFDTLDGTVARMTRTTSRFGVEYDSLCDLLSFGAAPAALLYQWALRPDKFHFLRTLPSDDKTMTLGFVVAFVFLACGALRLARFNVSAGDRDPGFFQGLPITGGAAIVAAAVLWHSRFPGAKPIPPEPALVLTLSLVLSFLMVSNLDFFSLKNKMIARNSRPFETLVLLILVLALLIIKGRTLLFPLGLIFMASGPVTTFIRARRRRLAGLPEALPSGSEGGSQDRETGPGGAGDSREGPAEPAGDPSSPRAADGPPAQGVSASGEGPQGADGPGQGA